MIYFRELNIQVIVTCLAKIRSVFHFLSAVHFMVIFSSLHSVAVTCRLLYFALDFFVLSSRTPMFSVFSVVPRTCLSFTALGHPFTLSELMSDMSS